MWIRLIIEFLGTFVLVTVAAGSGVINHYAGGVPISRAAAVIAPGAVVMAMIYAWGPLSRHQPGRDLRLRRPQGGPPGMGGAVLGGPVRRGNRRCPVPSGLVSVILNTATGSRSIGHNAAIAVGSTVAPLGLFASPTSGASMNPARTLGPDIVGNDYTGWWVYIAGPVIGAAIAVMIIGAVRGMPDKEEREAAERGALPILGGPRSRATQ